MYKTVLCHLLIVAIALQSLLAFVVAHPLHDQAPHHHDVSVTAALSVSSIDAPQTDHVQPEHCCHFHLGCGVFATGNPMTLDFCKASLAWSDLEILIPSTQTGSLFRPPIV